MEEETNDMKRSYISYVLCIGTLPKDILVKGHASFTILQVLHVELVNAAVYPTHNLFFVPVCKAFLRLIFD